MSHHLATYGSLAPGQPNHHHLDGMQGTWITGDVHGHRHEAGWGAAIGFPGLELDDDGPAVPVSVFVSEDLPANWSRLDEFEGDGYERVPAVVHTADGTLIASIYVLAAKSV